MPETRKRVPAKRHDPEMENFVYEGGQSLHAKGRRGRADSASKTVRTNRDGRTSANGKQ